MVPAATPARIVARLGAEVVQIMNATEIAERARALAFRIDAPGPEPFAVYLAEEIERWGRIIRAAGIKTD